MGMRNWNGKWEMLIYYIIIYFFQNPNVPCLGCDTKKTIERSSFRIKYDGENRDVDICADCNKKPED